MKFVAGGRRGVAIDLQRAFEPESESAFGIFRFQCAAQQMYKLLAEVLWE